MKQTITFLLLQTMCFSADLTDVVNYSLKEAPQFKEAQHLTQSQIFTLQKVLAVYDTYLTSSLSHSSTIDKQSLKKADTNTLNFSANKNVGGGVSLGTSYGFSTSRKSDINSDTTEHVAKVSADIDLLKNVFGRIDKNAVSMSEIDQKILNQTLKQTRQSLIYGLVVAYLQISKMEGLLLENRALLESVKNLENATKRKKQLGASETRHVLQMEAKRMNFELNNMELERKLKASYDNLSILTGGKRFTDFKWPEKQLSLTLKTRNLELEKLQAKQDKLMLSLENSQSSLLPSLKLSTSLGYRNIQNELGSTVSEKSGQEMSIGLSIQFPLGNTEAKRSKQAVLKEKKANEIKMNLTKFEHTSHLKQYEDAINSYKKQFGIAEKITSIQSLRYKEEKRAYNQGRSDITQINNAQNDLINSKISAFEKKYDYYLHVFKKSLTQGFLEDHILMKREDQ